MSLDWRELLDRLLEGEPLSEAEVRALADALGTPPGSREAAEWLCFEAALRERLAPPDTERVALSRERLLAKALLREKSGLAGKQSGLAPVSSPAREAGARDGGRVEPSGGERLRRRAITVAAVALIAVAAALLADGRLFIHRPEQAREVDERYAEPEASGEFEVLSPRRSAARESAVRRGDLLVAGPSGARLTAGGYCDLALDPKSEVVVRGEPGREEIELTAGRVVSRITPARGLFRVRTPLGSLDVVGTEFITSVVPGSPQEGEEDMGRLRKAVVVTVMVVSGTVAYHFGDSVGLLCAGGNQAFGAEEGAAPALPDSLSGFNGLLLGTVTSKGEHDFVLKIDRIAVPWKESKAENPDAAVGKEAKLVVPARLTTHFGHTLAGLKVGDQIVVEAFHQGGEELTVGELLRKAGVPASAAARPEGEGGHERLVPREGAAEHGHGDALVPREGAAQHGHGDALVPRVGFGGSNGLLIGTLLRKSEAGFVLKVESATAAPGKSLGEHAEGLAGKEVEVTVMREGRPHPQRSRDLGELKPGDRVVVGVRPTDGGGFAAVSVLRKADASSEGGERKIERKEGEGHDGAVRRGGEGEAPNPFAGVTGGFKSLVVGTIVSKGEEDFALKVDKVSAGPDASEAERADALDGQTVTITVRRGGTVRPRHAEALAGLKVGDRALVGVQHVEGKTYAVVSVIRRTEDRPAGARGERDGAERREGAPGSTEAIKGFRGVLQGTIQEKGEDGFVLRVEKVAKVWQSSEARSPEGIVGSSVRVIVKREEGEGGLRGAFGTLKAGDRIAVGAIQGEGDRLVAAEMLRKVEGE